MGETVLIYTTWPDAETAERVGAEAVALAFDHGGHVGQKFFQRFDAQLQGLDIDGCWAGCCCGCGHGGAFFDS